MLFNAPFLLQLLGIILLATVGVVVVRWLYKYMWMSRQLQGSRLVDRYGKGSWVLITGASDGLGKAFAQKLAGFGFNLLLVSRTQAKLTRLQAELETQGIEVKTVCADLSDPSDQTYASITDVAQDLDLSIVINCVGVTVHRRYRDIPAAALRRLLSVNISTTSMVTYSTLPLLLNHAEKTGHRSAFLNVGSIVGRFYWPGTQLYGACKAFVDHLTVPLAHEYRDQLDVLSFQPTVMATAMAAGTEPAAITITPDEAAKAALAHLGRYKSSHGHWRHASLAVLFSILPTGLRNRIFLSKALEMGEVEQAQEN
jgi:17beta-estradiol 17-dehydrogenase / very-long-chain 3-oxoacyl-CoA reductase